MTIRNPTSKDSTTTSGQQPVGVAAPESVICEPAQLRSNKAARKPRVEAQMRRRAEELRALLRDLD
jgi:hypothetical protein